MCGWQVKLCDLSLTPRASLMALKISITHIIKCYTNVLFTVLCIDTTMIVKFWILGGTWGVPTRPDHGCKVWDTRWDEGRTMESGALNAVFR